MLGLLKLLAVLIELVIVLHEVFGGETPDNWPFG